MEMNKIYEGDCLEGMKALPDNSVDCCITSPPYYCLRDYDMSGQLGLERTPDEYVEKMVQVFNEVRRILKPAGTLWLNIGDSYAANRGSGNSGIGAKQATNSGANLGELKVPFGLKEKDLIGIPWMVAFALRSAGWYLRQDIIWHKPNPMPESVTDRCTKSHEYIFLFSKSAKYYYDHKAIKTPSKNAEDDARRIGAQTWDNKNTPDHLRNGIRPRRVSATSKELNGKTKDQKNPAFRAIKEMANKRSVWTINTMPYSEAHFATFPEKLIVDCIKAGCPWEGVIIDPFMGAGTTALVARKLERNFIGFELNPEYIEIAEKRLKNELGMFI